MDKNYRVKHSRKRNSLNASFKYFETEIEAINYAYHYSEDQNLFLETKNIIGEWTFKSPMKFGTALCG